MKKPTNQRNVAPLSQRPRRARLLAGISVIAAAGFIPGTAQAAELNFADYAKAVQSSQALAIAPAAAESNRTILSPAIAALPSGLDEFAVERLEVGHSPILSVGLVGHETAAVRGAEATFIGYSNYPAALDRGEIDVDRNILQARQVKGIWMSVMPVMAHQGSTSPLLVIKLTPRESVVDQ